MRIKPAKILCAIDFSDAAEITLSYGKSLAAEFGSTLFLCHIVSGTLMVSSLGHAYLAYAEAEGDRIELARERLEKMAKDFDINCEVIVSCGHAADEINETARKNDIDMVIAATHGGSGLKRFLVGSVTDRLIKILTCPLLVLHSQEDHPVSPVGDPIKLKRILVGCDFSPDSKLAFDYALSLAQEFQTQLHLAHVIRPLEGTGLTTADYLKIQGGEYTSWDRSADPALQRKLDTEKDKETDHFLKHIENQLSQMVPEESRNWCTPVTALLEGQPYDELIRYCRQKEMDMIVLGFHGRGLLEQFLVGSTTDRVIARSAVPVLVVRQFS